MPASPAHFAVILVADYWRVMRDRGGVPRIRDDGVGTMSAATKIETELQELLAPQRRQSNVPDFLEHVPLVKCASGLSMSVQASRYHYCSPRDSHGPWSSVEIGFPTKRVAALLPYAEEKHKPKQTVYGFVPIKVLAQVIADNGGLAESAQPSPQQVYRDYVESVATEPGAER